ncbi:MAG: hypothetical protein AAF744_02470 [Pseudomonadota bacterium]
MIRAALAALLLGSAAGAETLDTAEKFESYVADRTLFFHRGDGRVYASERYLPGRRVRWSRIGETCLEGEWWAQDGLICFAYETNPEPQCWRVALSDAGLRATSDAPSNPTVIYEAQGVTGEQSCTGPRLGV